MREKKNTTQKEYKKERTCVLKKPTKEESHAIIHPLNMKSAGVFTGFTNRQKYYRIAQCAKDPDSAGESM